MNDNKLEFHNIYDSYQVKIYRYLVRLVGECEAEDLTQEVFVKVHRALEDFRGEAKLSTWLYRIATNVALDRLRSPTYQRFELCLSSGDSSDVEVGDQDAWTREKKPSVEQQLVRKEMNTCILDHINRLPETYRTVLLFSEMEEISNKEIAEILGVSLNTIKIRLYRARERLREDLAINCDSSWLEENEFIPELR